MISSFRKDFDEFKCRYFDSRWGSLTWAEWSPAGSKERERNEYLTVKISTPASTHRTRLRGLEERVGGQVLALHY